MIVERAELAERIVATELPPPPDWAAKQAAEASEAATRRAAVRLSGYIGHRPVDVLAAHLADVSVTSSDTMLAPSIFGESDLCDWLRREPRLVAAPGAGGNAEIEFRDASGKLPGALFGDPLEPDADRVLLHVQRVLAAVHDGVTLGVRHLDRSCLALGDLCNDLAAVSGADAFTKLFVSAGQESVTGWHQDPQDVLVLMLWGKKRFQVAQPGADPGQSTPFTLAIDVDLREGDCLLLPKARMHRAVPLGDWSGLMSIALLRHEDWLERGCVPAHLGTDTFPSSGDAFRLLLRSRYAPLNAAAESLDRLVRTRSPGGIRPVAADGPESLLALCGGRLYRLDHEAFTVLADIHALGPIPLRNVLGSPTALPLANQLAAEGLVDVVGGQSV